MTPAQLDEKLAYIASQLNELAHEVELELETKMTEEAHGWVYKHIERSHHSLLNAKILLTRHAGREIQEGGPHG